MVFKVGSNNIDTDDVAEGAINITPMPEQKVFQLTILVKIQLLNLEVIRCKWKQYSSASNNNVVIHPAGNGATQIKGGVELNADDEAVNVDIVRHNGTNGLMLGGILVTSSAGELNKLDGYTGSASDLQKIADYTGTTSELNVLDLGTAKNVGIFKIATSVPTQASDFTGNTKNNNGVLMVLSVLDGSTLRTPHNIYVLDGSTVRRVRQIRALDGSNISASIY